MKKCTKTMALLAAAALLSGGLFLSCSNSDDDDDTTTEQTNNSNQNQNENTDSENTDSTVSGSAVLAYTATDDTPAFALSSTSTSGIFGTVSSDFATAAIGTVGGTAYTMDDGYPKVAATSFTPSDATNSKVVNAMDGTKASLTGYTLKSSLKDGSTKLAITQDEECAYVEYAFTLSAAADVTADVVAFNSQSGNLYGKVSILTSDGTEKAASDALTSGSKEDNDASCTASSLEAGSYKVHFAWCPTTTKDAVLKAFLGGVQSVTITATAK